MTSDDRPNEASRPRTSLDLLRMVVEIADRELFTSAGLTLHVAGGVVTGMLVSRRKWLEDFGAQGDAALEALALEVLDAEQGIRDRATEASQRVRPEHVHLIDARLLTGGHTVPTETGMLWCGRLDDVAGWSMGRLA